MANATRQLSGAIAALGATHEVRKDSGRRAGRTLAPAEREHEIELVANDGHTWNASHSHTYVLRGPDMPALVADAIAVVAMGTGPCDDNECEWCER
jgi:hypothetical protein